MNADEIRELLSKTDKREILESLAEDTEDYSILNGDSYFDKGDYLEIMGAGIFSVHEISSRYSRFVGEGYEVDCGVYGNDGIKYIDVLFKREGEEEKIGCLVLSKGSKVNIRSLPPLGILCYLRDVSYKYFGHEKHIFSRDYFITEQGKAEEYDKFFKKTSDIWGGFTHNSGVRGNLGCSMPDRIDAKKLTVPSIYHAAAFSRYTYSKSPFDRFLRLYHCVELLFDAIIVWKIKRLNEDIEGFSQIISSHGKSELDRLNSIASNYVENIDNLVRKIANVRHHKDIAKAIFHEYSKTGDPLSSLSQWEEFVQVVSSPDNCDPKEYKSAICKKNPKLNREGEYNKFMKNLIVYWIYRFRCGVVHNRIGEFIMSDDHYSFVEDFAEPLLLEFCKEVFSSAEMEKLSH